MKNKTNLILFGLICLVFVLLKPILIFDDMLGHKAVIEKGVLNADRLQTENYVFELAGEVESYANQLIETSRPETASFVWRGFPDPWKASENVAYGSQRFVIRGLEKDRFYAFYMMDALTAYTLIADGQVIARQGVVADNKAAAKPEAKTQLALFKATGDETEIIIQVSNFDAPMTGIWQKTLFGRYELVSNYEQRAVISDAFIIGAILFLSIYMWILFCVLRHNKTILYFAASCSFIVIKSLFAGQQLGFEAYTWVSYAVGLKIAYLMIPAILVTFVAFVRSYFPEESSTAFFKLSLVVSGLEAMVILFGNQRFYMETFLGYQIFILISACTVLYWVIKALRNKREGSLVYLIGFLFFFIFVFNDILYSMLIIKTGYYMSFGLFVLIMAQATLVALQFWKSLKTEQYLIDNLENMVGDRTLELEAEKDRFETLSKVDSLTLLYNKGHLTEVLAMEFEGYKRYNGALSILMMDLDHFKKVNDTYGHVKGDEVLQKIAETLQTNSRRSDIIGRFGGEEFMVIMRFTALSDAMKHGEYLRRKIEDLVFESDQGPFHITASFGAAEAGPGLLDEKSLIHMSDQALYRAKMGGRNRVEAAEDISCS